MARTPKPWWRAERQAWFVTIAGERYNLGPDKEAAMESFRRLQRQAQPVSSESLAGVIDQFLSHVQEHRKPRTYTTYQPILKRVAAQFGYDYPAEQLSARQVDEWVSRQDWSKSYKGGVVRTLKVCYRFAESTGALNRNPLANLRGYGVAARDNLVSPEAYQKLLELSPEPFRRLIIFVWETGCRVQEVRIVEAKHVDNDRIIIPGALAKGAKHPRIIYMTPAAIELLRILLAEHKEGPLFRNEDGKPWTAYAIACQFGRLAKKIGHRYALTDFRHTFAHRLLSQRVDALTVATLMGHANPSMVATVYGKLTHAVDHLRRTVRGEHPE